MAPAPFNITDWGAGVGVDVGDGDVGDGDAVDDGAGVGVWLGEGLGDAAGFDRAV